MADKRTEQIIINGETINIGADTYTKAEIDASMQELQEADKVVPIDDASVSQYYSVPLISMDASAGSDGTPLLSNVKTLMVNPSNGYITAYGNIYSQRNISVDYGHLYVGNYSNTGERNIYMNRKQWGTVTSARIYPSSSTIMDGSVGSELNFEILYGSANYGTEGPNARVTLTPMGLYQVYGGGRFAHVKNASNGDFNRILDSSNFVNYCYSKDYIDASISAISAPDDVTVYDASQVNDWYCIPAYKSTDVSYGDDGTCRVKLYANVPGNGTTFSSKTPHFNMSTGQLYIGSLSVYAGAIQATGGNIALGVSSNSAQRNFIINRYLNKKATYVTNTLENAANIAPNSSLQATWTLYNGGSNYYISKLSLTSQGLYTIYSGSDDSSYNAARTANENMSYLVLDSSNYTNYCYSKDQVDSLISSAGGGSSDSSVSGDNVDFSNLTQEQISQLKIAMGTYTNDNITSRNYSGYQTESYFIKYNSTTSTTTISGYYECERIRFSTTTQDSGAYFKLQLSLVEGTFGGTVYMKTSTNHVTFTIDGTEYNMLSGGELNATLQKKLYSLGVYFSYVSGSNYQIETTSDDCFLVQGTTEYSAGKDGYTTIFQMYRSTNKEYDDD